ncbi:unnamed protein product [Meloidogyne enterolobii]|uniref:Uncharacterized protein n=1 Tax=Meloidogyne enterolobii TaxID=390850 RepID=A0ACB0XWJ9_MELEN
MVMDTDMDTDNTKMPADIRLYPAVSAVNIRIRIPKSVSVTRSGFSSPRYESVKVSLIQRFLYQSGYTADFHVKNDNLSTISRFRYSFSGIPF